MVLKNRVVVWLSISIMIAIFAMLSASAFCASARKSKFIMVPTIAVADADSSSSEVNVVTSDDYFARVHVSPDTAISQNGKVVTFGQIKRGYKITCKGNWDSSDSNVFKASYVFVGKKVSDSEVTDRVANACRKIAAAGAASRKTSSPVARVTESLQPETSSTQVEKSHRRSYL